MLFLGWILLVWAAGEAESMAQGKETGRWILMHTDATWWGTGTLGNLGLGPHSPGADMQARPHAPTWRRQSMINVTLPPTPAPCFLSSFGTHIPGGSEWTLGLSPGSASRVL